MVALFRSALMMAVGTVIAVSISTLPTRAADDSKLLTDRIATLEKQVDKLQKKLKYTHIEKGEINGLAGPHMIIEGCNLHIRSGSGNTSDGTVDFVSRIGVGGTPLGLGNLVVGYNEVPGGPEPSRGGSHNLIVGPGHNYASVGGVVFGQENSISGPLACATGGYLNGVDGYTSCISGGAENTAFNYFTSVSGGRYNTAIAGYSSISGGITNRTNGGLYASVSGGIFNQASGAFSSISGGSSRIAGGEGDWVGGGLFQDN